MSAHQCWLAQRERLRESLRTTGDTSGAAYLTRHALAQVEQNAMAEQSDDLLRQQTGILFSCCKTSLNLLDISVTTKVWVAQTLAQKPKKGFATWALLLVCALQIAVLLYAYVSHLWLLCVPPGATLIATIIGWVSLSRAKKLEEPTEDRLKVTAKPDTEKLFAAIDAQMKAIDRYINDFAYLNEQNAMQNGPADVQSTALLAGLMQAVYECEGDGRDEAVSAAERLLDSAGVHAVVYSSTDAHLFNVLPSITETRTLVPALLSQKDGALLYRGTAAVIQITAHVPSEALSTPSATQAQGVTP